MAKISITNFSCIHAAEIELGKLTVLVGPQASGKSVISKLIYFANEILTKQFDSIDDEKTLNEFSKSLEQSFLKLFPATAWGNKRFIILYEAGEYQLKITGVRKPGSAERTRDRVKLEFTEKFSSRYAKWLDDWVSQKKKLIAKGSSTPQFQLFWRFRDAAQKELRSALGDGLFSYQLFIPAGRSFFTSVGKAIAVFEHGGMLDPMTVQFGKFFASVREQRGHRYFLSDEPKPVQLRKKNLMQKFFGGSIEFGRDEEFVQTSDGRKIPFGILSSGQQELLPLWMVLDGIQIYAAADTLVFIEEPEAHLFPSSQADITNFLASLISGKKNKTTILITTHSPYVLANINNLMKAGFLGSKYPAARDAIDKIVPRTSWLYQDQVRAYALKNGVASQICQDGLIDAEYLDEVSGEIAAQFLELLEIENKKWPSATVNIVSTTPE